jgi:hypothetical protein
MSPQKIMGVVLLVVGVGLLVVGVNASHSLADQVSDTFTGHFTDATTWYILGGIGCGVAGLFVLLAGLRHKGA